MEIAEIKSGYYSYAEGEGKGKSLLNPSILVEFRVLKFIETSNRRIPNLKIHREFDEIVG